MTPDLRTEIPHLHEYLTDEADWDADSWDFEPEGLERLARTLEWLYPRMPEAFALGALWSPATLEELSIGRRDLIAVVEANAISTRTVYLVNP